MGTSANRGVTQQTANDLERNAWSTNNAMADQLADLIPYFGTKSGNTDSGGYVTVTHNLGFTPSHVFVQSRQTGLNSAAQALGVDTITGVSFRVRFLQPSSGAAANNLGYNISWMAVK